MPEPGIYLTNSTGETVALATESGGGDRQLLQEALEEYGYTLIEIEPEEAEDVSLEAARQELENLGLHLERARAKGEGANLSHLGTLLSTWEVTVEAIASDLAKVVESRDD